MLSLGFCVSGQLQETDLMRIKLMHMHTCQSTRANAGLESLTSVNSSVVYRQWADDTTWRIAYTRAMKMLLCATNQSINQSVICICLINVVCHYEWIGGGKRSLVCNGVLCEYSWRPMSVRCLIYCRQLEVHENRSDLLMISWSHEITN